MISLVRQTFLKYRLFVLNNLPVFAGNMGLVINTHWEDYDEQKKALGQNPSTFDCFAKWEMDYLQGKIAEAYPRISDTIIRTSIILCCVKFQHPQPRKLFVRMVTELLEDLLK
ncbi:MAG TPA: hypothetical protein VEC12_06055 [Bacteroidia bacterium]|nr:hypothetical protein [Bacteroidia bacterium]